MKVKNQRMNAGRPWYSPENSEKNKLSVKVEKVMGALSDEKSGTFTTMARIANGLTAIGLGITAGVFFAAGAWVAGPAPQMALYLTIASVSLLASLFFLLRQIGTTTKRVSPQGQQESAFPLGIQVIKGEISAHEGRRSLPAPELALHQFVQQVKAYAAEKSYQKARSQKAAQEPRNAALPEPVDLLKRRWNDVLDSLNEFEIYLAGEPQAMIDKLLARYPSSLMDVSQIFRDVAESFDTSWRRKGINIESAIVTPLKATTNEPILRRVLVGPWRACAYFAKRGHGVVFSAQSQEGQVVARWECEGLSVPESYLAFAQNSEVDVNERIEEGMTHLAPDPHSANTLFGLISLITWIDLAKAANIDFRFKNTNEGFVISLNLT